MILQSSNTFHHLNKLNIFTEYDAMVRLQDILRVEARARRPADLQKNSSDTHGWTPCYVQLRINRLIYSRLLED